MWRLEHPGGGYVDCLFGGILAPPCFRIDGLPKGFEFTLLAAGIAHARPHLARCRGFQPGRERKRAGRDGSAKSGQRVAVASSHPCSAALTPFSPRPLSAWRRIL